MKVAYPVILSVAKNLLRMQIFKTSKINLEILRRRLLRMTTILLPFLLFPSPAYAACVEPGKGVQIGECFGFGDIKSVGDATNKGIPTLFTLLAAIVVIYFVWGAFKFILSRGNKEEVAEARGMITHAIIGFIILIFIFFILQFLLNSLFKVQFSIIGT